VKHLRKPTMPVPPWELPAVEDIAPVLVDEPAPAKPKKAIKPLPLKPRDAFPKPVGQLAGRVFMGPLNVSDLAYMAKALLQMHDELCELRERIRILEAEE